MGHARKSVDISCAEYNVDYDGMTKRFPKRRILISGLEITIPKFWQRMWLLSALVQKIFLRIDWEVLG